MKYTIAIHNNTVFVTIAQAGADSFRDFCKDRNIHCSGYRYTTALTTINGSEDVVVILRNPHARYRTGIQFLKIGNNLKSAYIDQHTRPYLDLFKNKKIRYVLFSKLCEYFPLDSDPEVIVPIKNDEYSEHYFNGELNSELETYNHIIENNEELTVEEFNKLWS